MKKMHFLSVLSLTAVLGAPAFAAGGLEVKGGIGSIKDAGDKIGFDAGVGYAYRLDRFFAVMPEINFNWLSYAGSSGGLGSGGVTGSSTPSSNYYTMPVMLNGRIYIPMGTEDTPVFQPIITVGAGYGWSSYIQTNPTQTATLSGFMYQAAVGGLLNLGMVADGSPSPTNVLLEVGYRGGLLSTSGINVNYSGFFTRVGVSLSF